LFFGGGFGPPGGLKKSRRGRNDSGRGQAHFEPPKNRRGAPGMNPTEKECAGRLGNEKIRSGMWPRRSAAFRTSRKFPESRRSHAFSARKAPAAIRPHSGAQKQGKNSERPISLAPAAFSDPLGAKVARPLEMTESFTFRAIRTPWSLVDGAGSRPVDEPRFVTEASGEARLWNGYGKIPST
jgi:hypothetical protein